jgi:hypothetical protein
MYLIKEEASFMESPLNFFLVLIYISFSSKSYILSPLRKIDK